MKILYHHRTASRDGQSTHIEEMVRALRSIGCSVELAAPAVPADDAARSGSGGWVGRVKKLLPRPFYELDELAYSVVAYRRLARLIRAQRPDGIYERYSLFLLAGVAGLAAHWQGKLEFKRETDPSLRGMKLFVEAMKSKSPPALAPGVFVQLAALGLAYTTIRSTK